MTPLVLLAFVLGLAVAGGNGADQFFDGVLKGIGWIALVFFGLILFVILGGIAEAHPEVPKVGMTLFGLLFAGIFVLGIIERYRKWRQRQGPNASVLTGVLVATRPLLLIIAWFGCIWGVAWAVSLIHDPAATRALFLMVMLAPPLLLIGYGGRRWWQRRMQIRARRAFP